MAFKDLFKRKEGGTLVGNLLRATSNKFSGGLLGNGAMKLKPGESVQENNAKLAVKSGAAAVAFNDMKNTGDVTKPTSANVKLGATKEWLKKNWYYVLIPVVVVVVLVKLFTPKKRKGFRK